MLIPVYTTSFADLQIHRLRGKDRRSFDQFINELLGVTPPDDAGRDKPPCCDADTGLPAELGDDLEELVNRAQRLGRRRR